VFFPNSSRDTEYPEWNFRGFFLNTRQYSILTYATTIVFHTRFSSLFTLIRLYDVKYPELLIALLNELQINKIRLLSSEMWYLLLWWIRTDIQTNMLLSLAGVSETLLHNY
jgi:hypothetical protein